MTGFPSIDKLTESVKTKTTTTTKTDQILAESSMTNKHTTGRGKRAAVVSVAASLVTAAVLVAVIVSLYYGTHLCKKDRSAPPEFQNFTFVISESPRTGKVEVNMADRVLITETRVPEEKLDDTVTLQDFNRNLQAVLDLKRNHCYILPLMTGFDEAMAVTRENKTDQTAMTVEKVQTKEAIPGELLNHALGRHIGDFCAGHPSYWLMLPPQV